MDFQKFSQELHKLNDDIKKLETDEFAPIYDGPLNPMEYFNSERKILWLLKEPYGIEDGGSKMEEWYQGWFKDDNTFKSGFSLTWKRVTYITHGLLFNRLWDEIDDYHHEMRKELKAISWINIQKIPKKNSATSYDNDIVSAYNNPVIKKILTNQIDLLDPDIIICGNTFKYCCSDLLQSKYIESFGDTDLRKQGKRIIIDAYHPAYPRGYKQEQLYVDNVINAVRKGLQ